MTEKRAVKALFDGEYYLRNNPDVAAAGVDPLRHYMKHGASERRQPHPLFDPLHYMASCPEARTVENPVLHFLRTAGRPWPSPHPLFDCQAYLSAHPNAVGNPLVDYLERGLPPVLEGSQFGQC